jgi:hypothetical protein
VQPGTVPEQRGVRGGAQPAAEQRQMAHGCADDLRPGAQVRRERRTREFAEPSQGRLEGPGQRVTSVLSVTR